jgi:NAD(P)H dehydrogenase (quinone)
MTVLPPTVFYEAWRRVDERTVQEFCEYYESRVLSLMTTEPIPFRTQNGGDYDSHQTLLPGLESDSRGFLIHQEQPPYLSNVELTRGSDFSQLHFARDSRSLLASK